jgi:hypothetical protein
MPFDSDNLRDGVLTEDELRDAYRELELAAVMTTDLVAAISAAIEALQALREAGYGMYPAAEPIAESVASTLDGIANDLSIIANAIPQGPNDDETDKYSYR